MTTNIINVAVGLITRHEQVLIAWRHFGAHQGQRYEFPGGKVEEGESVVDALKRELDEELGIQVLQYHFLRRITHTYPEKTVCLHVFKVTDFIGEAIGKEGQPIIWVNAQQLHEYHFPDANFPIVRAAHLPDFYSIAPTLDANSPDALYQEPWLVRLLATAPFNALVYLRQDSISPLTEALQIALIEHIHQVRPDLRLMVPLALQSLELPVAGFHLKQKELLALEVLPRQEHRPKHLFIAACHDAQSIHAANRLAVDAITLAPVYATPTHQTATPLGLDTFSILTAIADCPVYALGGVGPSDLETIRQLGGFGVAGIRGFL